MDLIRHILLESPLKLFVGLVLMLSVLATCWWFRPGRTTSWLAVGGLLLAVLLMIVQHVVVTDRERIRQILEDLALAVDCEEVATIGAAFDVDCDVDGMNKDQLMDRLESAFERTDVDEVKIVEARITVEGQIASVRLRAHARVRAPDWPYDYYLSSWELRFVRNGDDWLINRARHTQRTGISAGELLNLVTQ